MLPKKTKDFIPELAKELNLSEHEIGNIVNTYWKEIRKALSDTKAPRIMINGFGTFRVKESLVSKIRENHIAFLQKQEADTMTFKKHQWKAEVEKRLENIDNLIAMINSDKAKKQEVKIKQKEYVAKKYKKNLDE